MFQGHPSWRAIIGFYVKGLLVVIAICVVVRLIKNDAGLGRARRARRGRQSWSSPD